MCAPYVSVSFPNAICDTHPGTCFKKSLCRYKHNPKKLVIHVYGRDTAGMKEVAREMRTELKIGWVHAIGLSTLILKIQLLSTTLLSTF